MDRVHTTEDGARGQNMADSDVVAGPFGLSFNPHAPSTLIIYTLLTVTVNSFVPIPLANVLCVVGVLLYGLWLGFALNLFAAVFGCFLGLVTMRLFRPFFIRLLGEKHAATWNAIDRAVVTDGFKIPLLLRLTPVMPVVLSNAMLALTSVDAFTYVWTTFIGFIPAGLPGAYAAVVGEEILEEFPPKDPVLITTSVVGLAATILAVWKLGAIAHTELVKAGVTVGDAPTGDRPAAESSLL